MTVVSFNGIQKGCALKLCRKMILSKQGNTAHALHQSAVFNQSVSVAHQLIESCEETGFNRILGDVGCLATVTGLAKPFILIITPPDLFAIKREGRQKSCVSRKQTALKRKTSTNPEVPDDLLKMLGCDFFRFHYFRATWCLRLIILGCHKKVSPWYAFLKRRGELR